VTVRVLSEDLLRQFSEAQRAVSSMAETFHLSDSSVRHLQDMSRMVEHYATSPAVIQIAEMSERLAHQMRPLADTIRASVADTIALAPLAPSWADAIAVAHSSAAPFAHTSLLATLREVDFGFSGRDMDFAASMLHQLNVVCTTDFAGALNVDLPAYIRQLNPIFEQFDRLVAEEHGASRGYTIQAAVAAMFEAFTGTDTELDSPKKTMRFWLILVLFLWSHVHACHEAELHRTEVRDLRRVQREQAEMVAALNQAVLEATAQVAGKAVEPRVYVEVSEPGILREAPSGTSARIGRVQRGQVVQLLTIVKRWRYVELLDADLHEVGERGWLYRRNVKARSRR